MPTITDRIIRLTPSTYVHVCDNNTNITRVIVGPVTFTRMDHEEIVLGPEQLVTVRTKRGFARLEWQKLRERNEALDCRVYARAAAWIAGADRWPDEKWRDLEDQLGAAPTDTDPAGQINRPGQAPQGKRRSDWLGRREGWF